MWRIPRQVRGGIRISASVGASRDAPAMLVRAVSGLGSGEHTTLSSDDLHGKAGAREKVWANEQDKAALLKLKARLADENRHMDEEKEKQRLELILNRVR